MIYGESGVLLRVPSDLQIHEPFVITRGEVVSIHPTARIDSFTKIEGGQGVTIEERVHISSFCHINVGGGEVVLEAHSGCSSGVKVCSGRPDLSLLYLMPTHEEDQWRPIRLKTVVGKYAIVFANAVIGPGVTIGEGAVIGAGAVVLKNVPAWEMWAGVPARKIGERKIS